MAMDSKIVKDDSEENFIIIYMHTHKYTHINQNGSTNRYWWNRNRFWIWEKQKIAGGKTSNLWSLRRCREKKKRKARSEMKPEEWVLDILNDLKQNIICKPYCCHLRNPVFIYQIPI